MTLGLFAYQYVKTIWPSKNILQCYFSSPRLYFNVEMEILLFVIYCECLI